MSARKSWDIAPRPQKPAQPAKPAASRASAAPRTMRDVHASRAKASAPVRQPASVSTRNVTIARGKKARPDAKEPLRKRRKKSQKALLIVLAAAALLLLAAFFYAAWMPALRVRSVMADGPHAEEVKGIAQQAIAGTHAFVLPRNSLFFLPEEDLRARVLGAFPDVEAVSISSDGLNAIRVTTLPRAEAFTWCGVAPEMSDGTCYSANAEGLIFMPAPLGVATSSQKLKVYSALDGQEGASPVSARIAYASRIPEALRFVKAMQVLGADVKSVAFRADEADLRTAAGTRITYVLGREQESADTAASVFPQLSLNDGSIQYVDLRFPGKAYFKRAGEAEPAE